MLERVLLLGALQCYLHSIMKITVLQKMNTKSCEVFGMQLIWHMMCSQSRFLANLLFIVDHGAEWCFITSSTAWEELFNYKRCGVW